ncbi:hypothetical protein CSHISOI_01778 [Colletotrichum shisoi]|uniref:Uncharacterized protein n=1 Tax=Colletotrichum shisoi TaxID=2078593 RepID=A0A5Q4C2U3_9PEZI|nr:hypothetical protein CSHISOI_01778 [Colletotrichum shisoi]
MVWDTNAIRDGGEPTELEDAAGGLRYLMFCKPDVPRNSRRERPVDPFGPGQGGYWDPGPQSRVGASQLQAT